MIFVNKQTGAKADVRTRTNIEKLSNNKNWEEQTVVVKNTAKTRKTSKAESGTSEEGADQ